MDALRGEPELILHNARVITLDSSNPVAELVAIRNGRIFWVGAESDLPSVATKSARSVNCGGQILVPGFVDSHCHFLSYAASLLAVDCSANTISSISDLLKSLRIAASRTRLGSWIKGTGFDEFSVAENRFPTRWELDSAVPDHPIKIDHRSGHACVLNSKALLSVSIANDTSDPIGGLIDRDLKTGEPNGLLFEMNDYLEGRMPTLSKLDLTRAADMASTNFVSAGVTSIQDATPANSPQRWDMFKQLHAEGIVSPRVTLMAGAKHLQGFISKGMPFGYGDSNLNLGAVKIILTGTTGALFPSHEDLSRLVLDAREAHFQVAIHAVSAREVRAAIDVLRATRSMTAGVGRDRIEHCSECPPRLMSDLIDADIIIVTQPGFIYHHGDRYTAEVDKEMQPWLYRIASFQNAKLSPASSSDAPVISPNPITGIYAAVTRHTNSGGVIGPNECVSPIQALKMYTANAAYAAFQEDSKGTIKIGKLGDVVLLSDDPTTIEKERIQEIRPTLTIIGGKVVWEL